MGELELVGLHEDGERLVLADGSGGRFTVRIDEALRAAVRRDRPQLEHLRSQAPGTLPVREIQARIRAGLTAEQVADEAGVPVEHVRRYEGPVLAEREHVVTQARRAVLGGDGSPTLDDLVADRLAARGVEGPVAWDSARDATGGWRLTAAFEAGGSRRRATWGFDPAARAVTALDDEARWLSETDLDAGGVRRGQGHDALEAVVRPLLAAVDERGSWPDAVATDAILDDLQRRRGRRAGDESDVPAGDATPGAPRAGGATEPVHEAQGAQHADGTGDLDVDGDVDGGGVEEPGTEPPARTDGGRRLVAVPGGVHSPGVDPSRHEDGRGADAPGPEPRGPHPAGTALHPARGRRGRAKIPSWDEIMFGAKPEK